MSMSRYQYKAKAVAAHFHYADGDGDFTEETDLHNSTAERNDPASQGKAAAMPKRTNGHGHEITFTHHDSHIRAYRDGSFYCTEVTSWVTNLNVKDVLQASRVEARIRSEYDERWFEDSTQPRRARILPQPPVFKDLTIYGYPYATDLKLPAAFSYTAAERSAYLHGDGPEIEPVPISPDLAYTSRIITPQGKIIEVSADTRRIRVEDFDIVYFAEWNWLPLDDNSGNTAHWVELLSFDLKNPGKGGVGGVAGGGHPS